MSRRFFFEMKIQGLDKGGSTSDPKDGIVEKEKTTPDLHSSPFLLICNIKFLLKFKLKSQLRLPSDGT
jgi:hypothetical protein